jgi:hypothetical protein
MGAEAVVGRLPAVGRANVCPAGATRLVGLGIMEGALRLRVRTAGRVPGPLTRTLAQQRDQRR